MNKNMEGKKKTKKNCKCFKNWTTWQETWTQVQTKISTKLHVHTADLIMNYSEGIQTLLEEKKMLELTRVNSHYDKYRGKPDFYTLPKSLPKRFVCAGNTQIKCYCGAQCACRNEPQYFVTKAKPPQVHLVGIPKQVLDEKHITHETRNIYKRWQNSEYRQERMIQMSAKIAKIVPHWPDFDNLIVVGKKITWDSEDEETHPVSKEKISRSKDTTHKLRRQKSKVGSTSNFKRFRLSLEVNRLVLTEDCKDTGTRKIRLFLEYDVGSSEPSSDYLCFKNMGSVALRISWRKVERFRLLRNYTGEKWEKHGFYFDKRDIIILPGHTTDVHVWFKTENPGNYSECWELIAAPRIWDENLQVIVSLESYAYDKNLKEKVKSIVDYIDTKARNRMIKDLVFEILEQADYPDSPAVPCVFGEAELFQTANLFQGRPIFLYNEAIVDELKKIFDKVKSEDIEWDYSIRQMEKLVHSQDTRMYLENKRTELETKIRRIEGGKLDKSKIDVETADGSSPSVDIEVVKSKTSTSAFHQSRSGTPSYTSKELKQTKTKSHTSKDLKQTKSKSSQSTSILHQSKTGFLEHKPGNYVYTNQLDLQRVVRKFYSPIIVNSEREKYFACFSVMTACFNMMTRKLEKLEHDMNVVKERRYPPTKHTLIPVEEQPERLIYEYFESYHVPPRFSQEIYPFEMRRKPVILQNIPSDDVKKTYSTYLSLCKSASLKKHDPEGNKNEASEHSSKLLESKAKSSSLDSVRETTRSKGMMKELSTGSFNPYAEHFKYVPSPMGSVGSAIVENPIPLSEQEKKDYDYKQYLIVYTCLGHTVDAIVDTLQSFDCVVSCPVLKMVKPQFSNSGETNKNQ